MLNIYHIPLHKTKRKKKRVRFPKRRSKTGGQTNWKLLPGKHAWPTYNWKNWHEDIYSNWQIEYQTFI